MVEKTIFVPMTSKEYQDFLQSQSRSLHELFAPDPDYPEYQKALRREAMEEEHERSKGSDG
ncbi:MAG: hypothetical protein WC444_00040 [Candidatus Paceibacterota bacterium]